MKARCPILHDLQAVKRLEYKMLHGKIPRKARPSVKLSLSNEMNLSYTFPGIDLVGFLGPSYVEDNLG